MHGIMFIQAAVKVFWSAWDDLVREETDQRETPLFSTDQRGHCNS